MKRPRSCDLCKETLRPQGGLHLDPPRAEPRPLLCIRCYLRVIDEDTGFDDDSPEFRPISTRDCEGVEHRFEFETRRFEERITIEAREIRDGVPAGYEFSVGGDPETDPIALFQALYQRLRRELGRKYLAESWRGPEIGDRHTVRGVVGWDSDEDVDVPCLMIDGREVSWQEMGRMLMCFEGWSFQLEVFDPSEEKP